MKLVDRFLSKVRKTETCWLWTAGRNSKGYGWISIGGRAGKNMRAHRVAYELFIGPIDDKWVLHKCDVPSCVNPEHLFLGSAEDNSKDMMDKGRGSGQFHSNDARSDLGRTNTTKTHCKKGHPYSGDNLVIYAKSSNRRRCRECMRAGHRRADEIKRQRSAANKIL